MKTYWNDTPEDKEVVSEKNLQREFGVQMELIKKTFAAAPTVSAILAALLCGTVAFGYDASYNPTAQYSEAPSPGRYADGEEEEEYVDTGFNRQVGYSQPVVYAMEQDDYRTRENASQQGVYASAPNDQIYAQSAEVAVPVIEEDKSIEEKFEELKAEFEALQSKVDKKADKPDSKKKFSSKLTGLFAFGSTIVNQNEESHAAIGDVQNGSALRDARFTYKAEGYDILNAELGISFCNDFFFRNVTVGVKKVPFFQEIKVGYFKAETDMNLQDAVIDTPAMYYHSNTMTYAVWRRIGAASTMYSDDKRIRWFNAIQTGKGWGNTAILLDDEPGLILTSRLTALPLVREDDAGNLLEIVHIGGSYMWVDPAGSADHKVALRQRPSGWYAPMQFVMSGSIDMGSKGYGVAETEIAWQRGPFAIQSETLVAHYDRNGSTWGQELFIRWMLDPESYHIYAYDRGCFGNVKLKNNFGKDKDNPSGAWIDHFGVLEPFVMLTYSDMSSLKKIPGSMYGDYFESIIGVNWWMNPQIKWAINYERVQCNTTKNSSPGDSQDFSNKIDTIGLQVNAAF